MSWPIVGMTTVLTRKLRCGALLTEEDAALLDRLASPVLTADAHQDIQVEGEPARSLCVILSGWACRYKQLDDGRRQIIGLLLPGDLGAPFGVLPRIMDHSIGALTPLRFARLCPNEIRAVSAEQPRIEAALWWDLLVQGAIQQELAVSLGRRQANERLAHFLCEMQVRLDRVGLADGASFELPLTQVQIADALGLTPVHVNRTLRDLRAADLIAWRRGQVTILQPSALLALAFFDSTYLHLDRLEVDAR